MRYEVPHEAGTCWWLQPSSQSSLGWHAQAANLLVAEDGRVQLADFGACALLERVEASAVMSESQSQASLDGGASCDGGSSPLPPQVPHSGKTLVGRLRRLYCRCLPGCGIVHASYNLFHFWQNMSCLGVSSPLHEICHFCA